jgi:hypothetical protein
LAHRRGRVDAKLVAILAVMSVLVLFSGSVLVRISTMPLAPQCDQDLDGLPDETEQEYGTDLSRQDSDGDGLSDYEETQKYLTNPLEVDSDGDGIEDADWSERREYTYSIQAIVDLRPPFSVEEMQDFYQDARVVEELGDDVTRLEVILYPEAREIVNPAPFEPKDNQCTAPTFTKNYSAVMQSELGDLVEDATTDLEATLRIIRYMSSNSRFVTLDGDLGYSTDLPLNLAMHLTEDGDLVRQERGEPSHTPLKEIERHLLFADSMFELGTHGTCSSMSTLRGGMLRSVGLEEKTIVTIPLLYFYEGDGTEVELRDQYWDDTHVSIPATWNLVSNHTFNLVRIGARWIRVDKEIVNGTGVNNNDSLHVKILEQDDILEDDFTEYWAYETWREKRPYKYISIIEQEARHSGD